MSTSLDEVIEKWKRAHKQQRDSIYYREVAPLFLPEFVKLPLKGYLGPSRPQVKALISVLGLSWQPVALMIAWAKAERVLILGTDDSLKQTVDGEPVLQVIANVSGFPMERLEVRKVEGEEEVEIYKHFKEFLTKHALRPKEVMLDPTGGKKSMSASAALAGFLAGAWIVYVDYEQYSPVDRAPVPGSEFPRLLHNPLEVFGDIELDQIKRAFSLGHYEEAADLAERLAERLYEPREAEALALIAKGYSAWKAFRFEDAKTRLEEAIKNIEKFGSRGRWQWAEEANRQLQKNLQALEQLVKIARGTRKEKVKPSSIEEGIPLILNHLAAAERSLEQDSPGIGLLLTYATLERYIDLILWVDYELDDEEPDYSKIEAKLKENEEIFHENGRGLMKEKYRPRQPVGPIGLALGIQLLATLDPQAMPKKFFGPFLGLMQDRNRCEYEHGLSPKLTDKDQVKKYVAIVKEAVKIKIPEVDALLEDYRFFSFQ